MHKVILDTDIGTDVDDALALAVLLGSKDLDLLAITTVYGDTRLRSTIAMHICKLVKKSVQTFVGESQPLSGREVWMNGSEGKNYRNLETYTPESKSAVEYLVQTINANPHSIEIIAIGPLTNIARAINSSPDFVKNVKRIWIMGGDFTQSKIEHNFKCDAAAAKIVLESQLSISILDLPNSQKTIIRIPEIDRIKDAPNLGMLLYSEIMSWIQPRNQDWTIPHDPIAALAMIAPEYFDASAIGQVSIDNDGYSYWKEAPSGNVTLLTPNDPEKAVERMLELITNCSRA
jgi:purine nucleosidase